MAGGIERDTNYYCVVLVFSSANPRACARSPVSGRHAAGISARVRRLIFYARTQSMTFVILLQISTCTVVSTQSSRRRPRALPPHSLRLLPPLPPTNTCCCTCTYPVASFRRIARQFLRQATRPPPPFPAAPPARLCACRLSGTGSCP